MLATMRGVRPRIAARWRVRRWARIGGGALAAVLAAACMAWLPPAALAATQAQSHSAGQNGEAVSLGTLARRVRAEHSRRERARPPRVYTNANLPAVGHISVFGQTPTAPAAPSGAAAPASAEQKQQVQAAWQQQVTAAQQQLSLDQQALSVTQRELNLSQQQYYSNPNVALQQQYSRSDIHQKAAQVDALKQKIQADQQHLQDLQNNPPGS